MSAKPNAAKAGRKPKPNNSNNSKNDSKKKRTVKVRSVRGIEQHTAPNAAWQEQSCLSQAVRAYVHAIVDPFDALPCSVPNQPPLMTRPAKYWSKGTFSTSSVAAAQDTGFIACVPINGVFNNASFIYYNSAAYSSTIVDVTTAGQFTTVASNADYPLADFSAATKTARIVAAGLRIRNITPALTRGGQCVGLAEPAHGTLNGLSIQGFNAYQESNKHGPKETASWIELLWRPAESDDMDFYSTFAPGNSVNGACLGFLIQGPAANPQSYEYEAYGIYELQGQLVTSKTFSVADTKGYEAITNTLVAAPKLHKSHVRDENMPKAAEKAAEHVVKHMQSHDSHSRYPPPDHQEKSFMSTALDLAPSFFNLIGSFL